MPVEAGLLLALGEDTKLATRCLAQLRTHLGSVSSEALSVCKFAQYIMH